MTILNVRLLGLGTQKQAAAQGVSSLLIKPTLLSSLNSSLMKVACVGAHLIGGRWAGAPKVCILKGGALEGSRRSSKLSANAPT